MNTRKLYRVKATMEYFAFANSQEEAEQYADRAISDAIPGDFAVEADLVLAFPDLVDRESGRQVYHDTDDELTLDQAFEIQTGRTFKQAQKIDRENFKRDLWHP